MISVVVFAILFFVLTIASNSAVNTRADIEVILPWLNATAYFLYVITGFLAGLIAKQRMIVNGLIAGILAAATAILAFGVAWGDSFGVVATVVNGGVFGGIGGAFAMILSRKKERVD